MVRVILNWFAHDKALHKERAEKRARCELNVMIKQQYKLKYLLAFILSLILLLSSCTTKNDLDILYTFDTVKMGSNNMKIQIEELEHHGSYSFLDERVYQRGSYAGAIMFSICSSSVIAKNRGYSYFTTLALSTGESCKSCEMNWRKTIGFLNDVPSELLLDILGEDETEHEKELRLKQTSEYLLERFPENLLSNKSHEITSVKDYWLICKNVNRICSW